MINDEIDLKELTRGFLHDMNNLYTVILVSLGAAKDGGITDIERQQHIDVAMNATMKSTEISSLLMRIWNDLKIPMERIDIGILVNEAVDILKSTIHCQIIVERDTSLAGLPVVVNRTAIVSVIINLITNADKAIRKIKESGTITVRYGLSVPSIDTGRRFIEVHIVDDGCGKSGMAFGRKPESMSKGSDEHGIGLGMVDAIVMQHGGVFKIDENEPGGLTVTVSMPVADTLVNPPL